MKNYSEVEKLDIILNEIYSDHFKEFFKDKDHGFITKIVFDASNLYIRFTEEYSLGDKIPIVKNVYEIHEVLLYLYNDGYLNDGDSKKYEDINPTKFTLNTKGRIFSKSGGYENQQKINKAKKAIQAVKDGF